MTMRGSLNHLVWICSLHTTQELLGGFQSWLLPVAGGGVHGASLAKCGSWRKAP
ncbi:hypothetical protein L873DRAFT_1738472, partial [Choiromyces venosus 120613-1]